MKAIVAHHSAPVLDGLAELVRDVAGLEDVVKAHSAAECLSLAHDLPVGLAVVDRALAPGGIALLCRDLCRRGVPVIALARTDSPDHLDLLSAGVSGLVLPDEDGLPALKEAVETVLAGDAYVPPRLLGTLLRGLIVRTRRASTSTDGIDRLSPREREVLALLAVGEDDRGIARELVISPHTAKTHITRVLGKLDVHSRIDAAALALEHGLVTPSTREARP